MALFNIPPPTYVVPRPWADKARRVSQWMMYSAGGLLVAIFMIGSAFRIGESIATGALIGAAGLGILGAILRIAVLLVGYSQFSLKMLLLFAIAIATGATLLVNDLEWPGIAVIVFVMIYVIAKLYVKDSEADGI